MNHFTPHHPIALFLFGLCLLLGCGRADPTAAERGRVAEPHTRAPLSAEERERVIRLVQQALHEEEGVSYEEWVGNQQATEPGSVLFREWSVMPRGENRYEVRFIYTLLNEEATRIQRGFSWSVDGLVNVVAAPRELNFPGSPRAPSPRETEQRRRVLQDQIYSLE